MGPELSSAKLFTDFREFDKMRKNARDNDPEALKQVAKQFEAIFLQMMLRGMRSANKVFAQEGFLKSDSIDFYQDMFDSQLSLNLSHKEGFGLAEVLVKQLTRSESEKSDVSKEINADIIKEKAKEIGSTKVETAKEAVAEQKQPVSFETPADFVKSIWADAIEAAEELGVEPKMLLAQAALETGWGKKISQGLNGVSSYNLVILS